MSGSVMALEIGTATSARELSEFVDLPFSIHSGHPLWVPPIKKMERDLLTPAKHPFWQTAHRELFIARENGRPVGRIAAIVDDKYNEYAGTACGTFGFFECEDNCMAAWGLLDAAKAWLTAKGMTFMRGPFNPSANYSCGLLVHGFEAPPAVMMPWNPPWYASQLETWGLRKEEDLFAYIIESAKLAPTGWLADEVKRLKTEARFTCRPSSKATLADDIRAMLEIYRISWAENWGFSPLSPAEAEEHVKELKGILDPEFFVLFFHEKRPVAGMVALPDINPFLQRINGTLGLAAPWHYWRSRAQSRRSLRIMLFGILPDYRLHGLPLLLFDYMLEKARSLPELAWVEGSWILERNLAMNDLMEDFSGRLAKRYRIYRRELPSC